MLDRAGGAGESGAMDSEAAIDSTPPEAKAKSGAGATTRFLLFLFLFALILRSFIVAPFVIPSGSMLPRMMIGDFLFVAKWPYGYSRFSIPFGLADFDGRILAGAPERGDVVVFRYPGPEEEDYVKRLIGLPGDTIQMRAGTLILNGEPVAKTRIADFLMPVSANSPCRQVALPEAPTLIEEGGKRFCPYPRYRETLPGGRSYEILDQIEGVADETMVYTVPAGHYFVMGDNRDDSADSRFTVAEQGIGFLPADHLIGKAAMVFFSTDGSAEWLKPWTWVSAARWDRIGGTY